MPLRVFNEIVKQRDITEVKNLTARVEWQTNDGKYFVIFKTITNSNKLNRI